MEQNDYDLDAEASANDYSFLTLCFMYAIMFLTENGRMLIVVVLFVASEWRVGCLPRRRILRPLRPQSHVAVRPQSSSTLPRHLRAQYYNLAKIPEKSRSDLFLPELDHGSAYGV